MTEMVNNNPSKLKEVFVEAVKLESLRAGLMKEIGVQSRRKSSYGEGGRSVVYALSMDGWMDGCMDGWMDGWMDEVVLGSNSACIVMVCWIG